MTWPNKPTTWWQWLLLLSPGILSVAMTAFGKVMLSRRDQAGPGILGVLIAALLSLALALYFAWGKDGIPKVLGRTLLLAVLLLVVNLSVAFAGCAVIKPRLYLGWKQAFVVTHSAGRHA